MIDVSSLNKQKEEIFLDTAFLASFSIREHKDFSKAQKLLAELVLSYEMYTSPLCFYELWQVVKEYNDFSKGNYNLIRKFNRILKFIHLKILFRELNFSYKKVIDDLKSCTNTIVQSGFITIIDLEDKNVHTALDAIEKFDTKPGDAFHFSIMKNSGIETVVSGNKRELERMGLKIIWF